jgi:hypothetical protein
MDGVNSDGKKKKGMPEIVGKAVPQLKAYALGSFSACSVLA